MDCLYCGKPEPRYKPSKGVDFICGTCVQSFVGVRSEPLDFKRGYIRALFLEDERWITCIEKYWMIIPGNPKNQRHRDRDWAFKEKLADQVHPDTYEDRLAYFQAWLNAKCCADDCDKYCDQCHGIKFDPVPYRLSKEFDIDVRRFMEKYQRFWLKSEQDKALEIFKEGVINDNKREISDGKDNDGPVRIRGRKSDKGFGLPGEQAKTAGDPFKGQEEMFLRS